LFNCQYITYKCCRQTCLIKICSCSHCKRCWKHWNDISYRLWVPFRYLKCKISSNWNMISCDETNLKRCVRSNNLIRWAQSCRAQCLRSSSQSDVISRIDDCVWRISSPKRDITRRCCWLRINQRENADLEISVICSNLIWTHVDRNDFWTIRTCYSSQRWINLNLKRAYKWAWKSRWCRDVDICW